MQRSNAASLCTGTGEKLLQGTEAAQNCLRFGSGFDTLCA